ncbi:helix-turn-helix domain-containing protein [Herbaspirillum sp. alder98]|uniref:helix-turn-helix domain-containing protein n=1 Tax=Herbaspirillum sp. alder98 TaxID=2913096 RepID=UPI001CD84495|nr:helix-turn-helix domain-containing protein [Herbaspirillum sp. alder98]MCA1325109.1 helix-turn-helix domain-containing protein [Herbaspirillum sp. alder98]
MKAQYSTNVVEAPRRFEYWNDVVCRHCLLADSNTLGERPFDGEMRVNSIGMIDMTIMESAMHHWRRDAHHIRTGPDDDLWLAFMVSGEGYLAQEGRHTRLQSGDMVLYDGVRPFEFALGPEQIYLARLPRKSLLSRCPEAEHMTAQLIDRHRPGVMALRSMLEESANTEFSDADAAIRYSGAVLDVLALSLAPPAARASAVEKNDLYRKVLAYLQKNYTDPLLNLHVLAMAHHVSERTLTRAFAQHNQTPMDVLRRVRLQASHRALTEGRAGNVTSAALDAGFSDLSHFSRVFRAAYGCTPQSLLSH